MVEKMYSYRRIAIIVGVLFIIATITSIVGGSLIGSVIDSSDDFLKISENENQIVLGCLLVLVDAFAVIFIAILMFPILKKHSEGLALGYVGLRIFEGVVFIIGVISILAMLTLSQEYISGALDASYFQALVALLLGIYDWSWLVGPLIFFALSTLPFYYLLYQSKLIPQWLSGWGLIGGVLVTLFGLLAMFGFDTTSTISMFLFLPIAIQEMVLAVWLIVKGFTQQEVKS